jgi:hypothetical protein
MSNAYVNLNAKKTKIDYQEIDGVRIHFLAPSHTDSGLTQLAQAIAYGTGKQLPSIAIRFDLENHS